MYSIEFPFSLTVFCLMATVSIALIMADIWCHSRGKKAWRSSLVTADLTSRLFFTGLLIALAMKSRLGIDLFMVIAAMAMLPLVFVRNRRINMTAT